MKGMWGHLGTVGIIDHGGYDDVSLCIWIFQHVLGVAPRRPSPLPMSTLVEVVGMVDDMQGMFDNLTTTS